MTGATHTLAAKIRELALPLVESMGLMLWGVDCLIGKRILVRIYLDALASETPEAQSDQPETEACADEQDELLPELGRQAVDVEQCAYLSRHLGLALEAEDCVPGAYTLEVSSPGLERLFFSAAQLSSYLGREVEAVLRDPIIAEFPGRKRFVGVVRSVERERVTLEVDGKEAKFPWSAVKKAHLIHRFPDPQDKKRGARKSAKQPS
jgi:ribosome maturation factor RimP